MQRVLFLCSANYYRSRFAEALFNGLAQAAALPWQADSRGLLVGRWGELSSVSGYVVEGLTARGIPLQGTARVPLQVSETDLAAADLVIALKEREHRPLLASLFPRWVDRIEYWHIDDLDCAEPDEALPLLEAQVRALLARLSEAAAA